MKCRKEWGLGLWPWLVWQLWFWFRQLQLSTFSFRQRTSVPPTLARLRQHVLANPLQQHTSAVGFRSFAGSIWVASTPVADYDRGLAASTWTTYFSSGLWQLHRIALGELRQPTCFKILVKNLLHTFSRTSAVDLHDLQGFGISVAGFGSRSLVGQHDLALLRLVSGSVAGFKCICSCFGIYGNKLR